MDVQVPRDKTNLLDGINVPRINGYGRPAASKRTQEEKGKDEKSTSNHERGPAADVDEIGYRGRLYPTYYIWLMRARVVPKSLWPYARADRQLIYLKAKVEYLILLFLPKALKYLK